LADLVVHLIDRIMRHSGQTRLLTFLFACCSILLVNVLQLRAQIMLTGDLMTDLLPSTTRRMQEQPSFSHRYLAIQTIPDKRESHESSYPLQVAKRMQAQLSTLTGQTLPFASACLQSLLGEQEFDYISVELGSETDSEAGVVLLQRIRQRYPSARVAVLSDTLRLPHLPTSLRTNLIQQSYVDDVDGISDVIVEKFSLGNNQTTTDQTGIWGSGDSCNFWYNADAVGDLDHSVTNFGFNSDFEHKHALEIGAWRDGGLVVSNPFSTSRMLSLSYMAALDDNIYPLVKVRVNGVPTVHLSPFHDDSSMSSAHLVRTTPVGRIPPHAEARVDFETLRHSEMPFRLVGASFLASEMERMQLEFSLETAAVEHQDIGLRGIGKWMVSTLSS